METTIMHLRTLIKYSPQMVPLIAQKNLKIERGGPDTFATSGAKRIRKTDGLNNGGVVTPFATAIERNLKADAKPFTGRIENAIDVAGGDAVSDDPSADVTGADSKKMMLDSFNNTNKDHADTIVEGGLKPINSIAFGEPNPTATKLDPANLTKDLSVTNFNIEDLIKRVPKDIVPQFDLTPDSPQLTNIGATIENNFGAAIDKKFGDAAAI